MQKQLNILLKIKFKNKYTLLPFLKKKLFKTNQYWLMINKINSLYNIFNSLQIKNLLKFFSSLLENNLTIYFSFPKQYKKIENFLNYFLFKNCKFNVILICDSENKGDKINKLKVAKLPIIGLLNTNANYEHYDYLLKIKNMNKFNEIFIINFILQYYLNLRHYLNISNLTKYLNTIISLKK